MASSRPAPPGVKPRMPRPPTRTPRPLARGYHHWQASSPRRSSDRFALLFHEHVIVNEDQEVALAPAAELEHARPASQQYQMGLPGLCHKQERFKT